MATIEQMINRTKYLVDDPRTDVGILIDFFNEALEDLSSIAGYEKKFTADMIANEGEVTLPNDIIELVRFIIKTDNGSFVARPRSLKSELDFYGVDHMNEAFEYSLFGKHAEIFPKPKTNYQVVVEYFGNVPKLPSIQEDSTLTATPEIPERFHKALPIYTSWKYFENWEDNPNMRENFQQQFEVIKQEMYLEYTKKVKRTRSNKVYINVGWD